MESRYKRLRALSITQIVLSIIFLNLGFVDVVEIRFQYTSLLYVPCWVAALACSIGAIGLCLATSSKPYSLLISAIWSLSVACILYSAMTVYLYHRGIEKLLIEKYRQAGSLNLSLFLHPDAKKLELTGHEKSALAVFGVIIMLSIIEIVLAAAICTHSGESCERHLSLPMHRMQNQERRHNPQLGRTRGSQQPRHQGLSSSRPHETSALEMALGNQFAFDLGTRYSEM